MMNQLVQLFYAKMNNFAVEILELKRIRVGVAFFFWAQMESFKASAVKASS